MSRIQNLMRNTWPRAGRLPDWLVAVGCDLLLFIAASPSVAQSGFYDATTGHQLADVPGASPVTVVYHAYPWVPFEKKYVPAIRKAAETPSKQLFFDYEPWALPKDHRQAVFQRNAVGIDPRSEPLENVQVQHQKYAQAIALALPLAKQLEVKTGIYSFLSLHHRRLEDVYGDGPRHDRWKQDQQRVLDLPITIDGKDTTLLEILNEAGGAVWVPWYVPNPWNNPRLAGKAAKTFPRLCAAIEAAGGKAIPILHPNTVGGKHGNPKTVLPELQRQLIRLAKQKYGNEWAVWAEQDQVTPEFRELIREELSR